MTERAIQIPTDPKIRGLAFLRALFDAAPSAEVLINLGAVDLGGGEVPAIHVSIAGSSHGFSTDEARKIADVFERVIRQIPEASNEFANTIMGLRAAADKADALKKGRATLSDAPASASRST